MRPPLSLLFSKGEKTQLLQSFLIGQVLQPFDHLAGPPWDPLQSVCVFFFELWEPELDTVLQVRPAGVASVRRGQGLPCAGHSWFQPARHRTHRRPKLSNSAKLVAPL